MSHCSDLKVSELLTLRHSLKRLEVTKEFEEQHGNALDKNCPQTSPKSCLKPAAMALVAEKRGHDASQPIYEPWQPEEKTSKLQTLFQISVTALAFLSFGGYLLCLIVQSIKSKGSTYLHPTTSTMATISGIKRIKVYRRSRRSSLAPLESTQTYNFYGQHDNYNSNNPYQYYQRK